MIVFSFFFTSWGEWWNTIIPLFTLIDTGHFIFHNGWVIVGDDNVAVMARSGVKDSFAVEPDLLDTLESCENQFLEIEKQASYIKVIFDREDDNYSTSKTKPIEGCSKLTKYLIDIDKIY